ncbi:NACHT domain-containing protein [Photobacterium carnosum]|uniref:NACHT domain-containing protein n=1 Tax=Photobacterium carnosum TaxID=2023717 RepID=UPI001E61920B|nr:NACHT domain-containing protein [Photobacterium carnosum]
MFTNIDSKHKLLLLIFVIGLVTIISSYYISGILLTIISSIFILFFLYITKNIWAPVHSKNKIRMASLTIIWLVASILLFDNKISSMITSSLLNPLFDNLLKNIPILKNIRVTDGLSSSIILIFVLFGIAIINYFMRDKSVMGEHPTSLNNEFPQKEYKDTLPSFCNVLNNNINKIDIETNWSSEYFTPLNAEVEIITGNKKERKVTDLLKAIQSDKKSQVFLILGDPGSGKSVALRKLCSEMIKEVQKTGRIPIYINLKDWITETPWSDKNPPTQKDLLFFIKNSLKSELDVFGCEFIDENFDDMFKDGRLFIILDSFDEIPSLLDENEKSWLVDHLSDLIYKTLAGTHVSRGILASRIFRKPTQKFQTNTTLEIRPFNEIQIKLALEKSISIDKKQISKIFKERPELISIARNPFTTSLISMYVKDNKNKLPTKQSDLYQSYINKRLFSANDRMKKYNLSSEDVINCASEIALIMFKTPSYGLGAPINELIKEIPNYDVRNVTNILEFIRLGRIGGIDNDSFSFSHRRFNEYLVATKLLEDKKLVNLESIPNDSRWRDALVMYCEIADTDSARNIAFYCWSEIKKLSNIKYGITNNQYIKSIHCLRFIRDAFRTRKDCLSDFIQPLTDIIFDQINNNKNIVSQKIIIESIGILDESNIDNIVHKALKINHTWVQDEAFKACRNLQQISKKLAYETTNYIYSISDFDFLKRNNEIIFSLSLSDAFKQVKKIITWRKKIIQLNIIALIISFILQPIITIITISAILLKSIFTTLLSNTKKTNRLIKIAKIELLLLIIIFINSKDLSTYEYFYTLPENQNITLFYNITAGLTSLMLIPYFDMYMIFKSIQIKFKGKEKIKILKEIISLIKLPILTMLFISLFLFLVLKFIDKETLKYIFSFIYPVIISITLSLFIISFSYIRYNEFKKLKNITIGNYIDRDLISDYLSEMSTSWGRNKLTNKLLVHKTILTGKWHNNNFPEDPGQEYISTLARIEEHSLNLN